MKAGFSNAEDDDHRGGAELGQLVPLALRQTQHSALVHYP